MLSHKATIGMLTHVELQSYYALSYRALFRMPPFVSIRGLWRLTTTMAQVHEKSPPIDHRTRIGALSGSAYSGTTVSSLRFNKLQIIPNSIT